MCRKDKNLFDKLLIVGIVENKIVDVCADGNRLVIYDPFAYFDKNGLCNPKIEYDELAFEICNHFNQISQLHNELATIPLFIHYLVSEFWNKYGGIIVSVDGKIFTIKNLGFWKPYKLKKFLSKKKNKIY